MSKIDKYLLFLLIVHWCSSQEVTERPRSVIQITERNTFTDLRCQCQIPTNQHRANATQPLFKRTPLTQETSRELQFIYPTVNLKNPMIPVLNVQLMCAGNGSNNLVYKSLPLAYVSSAVVRCARLNNATCTYRLFTPWNHYLLDFQSFSEITCTDEQVPEPRIPIVPLRYVTCGLLNVTCVEIGFPLPYYVSPLGFLPVIKFLAVDTKKLQPLVAHAWLHPALLYAQKDDGNYTFRKGPIFSSASIDVKEVYQRDYQRKRFLEIFEDQKLVDTYIPETGNSYLTEGQLVSEKDVYYKIQRASTFYYENTVPIWRDVATGNWEQAGKYVRQLAMANRIGYIYYSGTIDTLELADQEGNGKKIFLAPGQDGEPVIPVPKLLFKYIIGKRSGENSTRSLVVITVNDPRLNVTREDLTKEGYLIAKCSTTSICHANYPVFADPTKGFTYCCSGPEFAPYAKLYSLPILNSSEIV